MPNRGSSWKEAMANVWKGKKIFCEKKKKIKNKSFMKKFKQYQHISNFEKIILNWIG